MENEKLEQKTGWTNIFIYPGKEFHVIDALITNFHLPESTLIMLVSAFGGRIINIHPSLLPAFRGAHAIEQALEYGVKVFGVTIHYVDAELDGGRIIAQRAFPYEGDDIGELEAMIHAVEYPLYIETIKKLIE